MSPRSTGTQTARTKKPLLRKSHWVCGMCSTINPPRNHKRCKECGAERGMGAGYKELAHAL